MNRKHSLTLSLACLLCSVHTASAHFPWLVRSEDGKATLFFGETLAERNYKLPPSIAKAELMVVNAKGELDQIEVQPVESESLIGLQSVKSVDADACIVSKVTFGIYHGSRLNYYTMHRGASLPKQVTADTVKHDLSASLIDTESGVEAIVTYQGQPVEGVEVRLYCSEGHEEAKAKTDSAGKVSFSDEQVEDGLNAIMFGHNVKRAGKLGDAAYESESHYATVTFYDPQTTAVAGPSMKLAPLPFAITSFGAARIGDALYVYGGHTGDAHAYSDEGQSNKLLRLDLSKPEQGWAEVAEGQRKQGLGMVAYKDKVILIGGFHARNKAGEKQDLHSSQEVRAYDVKSNSWSELPSLPEARSSHDAVLIGDTIYVVGGWKMAGAEKTIWHSTALAMDLTAANPAWVEITAPPFKRRAIATVEHQGKLFVIGGMNERGAPTKQVPIYDPASKQWSEASELIGEEAMAGFGASGWSVNGKLIVTTYEGDIECWDDATGTWKVVGKASDARFFHRLLPVDEKQLVAIGGANMESGKYLDLELIRAE